MTHSRDGGWMWMDRIMIIRASLIIVLILSAIMVNCNDEVSRNCEINWSSEQQQCLTSLKPSPVQQTITNGTSSENVNKQRYFSIDHNANTFLMDGKPFHFISGSIHYFRALPQVWKDRLLTMKAGGLNTISTYVEWSLHNPEPGVYNWKGMANLEEFLRLAHELGFYVILRPGPYICAERDNGGIPYWLMHKYPKIQLRTSDQYYLHEIEIWFKVLMPRLQPFLYGNGGPIIMMQVENEYGSFPACDYKYLRWLRNEMLKYVEDKAILFTTDIPNPTIYCGIIENVFATIDFGSDKIENIDDIWDQLREVQPTGPLVNSEYYSGWLSHWESPLATVPAPIVANGLKTILAYNANVNIYMYFGGTNFGFTAGANKFDNEPYLPDLTSYDYDAVLTESGDITDKFHLIRNVIDEYRGEEEKGIAEVPPRIEAQYYGQVNLKAITGLLTEPGRSILRNELINGDFVYSKPKSFEQLGQAYGYILYETVIMDVNTDPVLLTVNNIRDRAYIYINNQFIGILSRTNEIDSFPLSSYGIDGSFLQILVENQGRINYMDANDRKGILGSVELQVSISNRKALARWQHTGFPFTEQHIDRLLSLIPELLANQTLTKEMSTADFSRGPLIYYGKFQIYAEPHDTYLNTDGWGKGIAFINNFNLGRYWSSVGPQFTLYVPKDTLRIGDNTLILIEFQNHNAGHLMEPFITLDKVPIFLT